MSSAEKHAVWQRSRRLPAHNKLENDIIINSYLLADGQPKSFLELAELKAVNVLDDDERTTSLCHSSLLARSSQVFGEMFLSTPKEGWANGVASMFNGHQKKIVDLVLAMIHGSFDVAAMLKGMGFEGTLGLDELEDLLRLAHKLDAPKLMNASEDYVVSQTSVITANFCNTLRIMWVASALELKDLKHDFMDTALEAILKSSDPVKTVNEGRDLVGGWQAVDFEDFYTIFTAVTKALKDSEKEVQGLRASEKELARYNYTRPPVPQYFKPDNADYRRRLLEM